MPVTPEEASGEWDVEDDGNFTSISSRQLFRTYHDALAFDWPGSVRGRDLLRRPRLEELAIDGDAVVKRGVGRFKTLEKLISRRAETLVRFP